MGDLQDEHTTNVFLLSGLTILTCAILHIIYKIVFGSKKKEIVEQETKNDSGVPTEETTSETKASESRPSGKSKKRSTWKGKTEFNHPWLMKNLKGHPGTVLMTDFSANGKFMAATCDEVRGAPESSTEPRRRKPRDRRGPPAPQAAPPPPPPPPPPKRTANEELSNVLQPYLISPLKLWDMGYPREIEPNSSKAVVYINSPPVSRPQSFVSWDVNAPEFVPGGSQSDSGHGSWGSTPRSESDEESELVKHMCARCDKVYRMTREGEHLQEDTCLYHWGRVSVEGRYLCCRSLVGSRGCSTGRYHVWSGTIPGMNGPLEGYVRARLPRGGVYALDTEMVYTTAGLELASIAVIAADGHLVYREHVIPSSPLVDCNTRFSGIRTRDLARATKTLRDIQNDILGFVGSDTILIGHALENDLRALKLMHTAVIDTSFLYPHPRGQPWRRSLRNLAEEYLGRRVQCGGSGHSPLEDARTALDLVLLKVRSDQIRERLRFSVPLPYEVLLSK